MKKYLFLTLTSLSFLFAGGQNLNYQKELERMIKIPNTPEAEAFSKYGNVSVSMYSGTPNISIPMYTVTGRELNLPVSLTYDASGVKVTQLASQAGLGWNLNIGGRITRIVNGLVDDFISTSPISYTSVYSDNKIYVGGNATNKTLAQLIQENLNPPQVFDSLVNAVTYFKFLKDVSDNLLDTQPDYFSFSALGYSDRFVYDFENKNFKALDNPRTKINVYFDATNSYITNWVVTIENGTKFYFNQGEKTHTEGSDTNGDSIVNQDYFSSWLLTKVESPNAKDTFLFSYTDLGLSETQPLEEITSITNEMDDSSPQYNGVITRQSTTYHVSQVVLNSIKHNNYTVVDINLKNRYDFNLASAIDKVNIYKFKNSGILKSYEFKHSYFGITDTENPASQNPFNIRLKLDEVIIQSADNSKLSSYNFEYFSPENVPSRASLSRDYLGLNNGANNNVLYPAVTISGTSFTGANRLPNFSKANIGNLTKITYPTGGYTQFTYEANKSPYTAADISATIQEVTYGSLNVIGGIGDGTYCGACCIDQYGNPPKMNESLFNITEAGTYDISFSSTPGDEEAYLFLRSRVLNYPTALPYNQVIDQSSCAELVPIIWSNFTGVNGDKVFLEPGTYQITLAKGNNPNGNGAINLKVYREEATSSGTIGTGEVERAGIRIKSISDYSSEGILSSEKEYQYKTEINGTDSSGKILFDPIFYVFSDYQVYISSPQPGTSGID